MSQISEISVPNQRPKHMATMSDGEEAEIQRRDALVLQEEAEEAALQEMREERNELAREFAKDDLSQKMLVQGIHKICILGVIKYH